METLLLMLQGIHVAIVILPLQIVFLVKIQPSVTFIFFPIVKSNKYLLFFFLLKGFSCVNSKYLKND